MNTKEFAIEQIDYIIEIMQREIKRNSINNPETNEYRYGQTKTANMTIRLLKEFKADLKKRDETEVVEKKKNPIIHKMSYTKIDVV